MMETSSSHYFIAFILGTNKSASLRTVADELKKVGNENVAGNHFFESGTMEGLMKTMCDNHGTILGVFDEFSTFLDNLDKGSTGASEKGRYLSLFSAVDWSKKTKSSGSLQIRDPRFLISFTQPYYALNFVRNSLHDGFFQRFLITIPAEVFVKIEEKMEASENNKSSIIDLSLIFEKIYKWCKGNNKITLSDDAFECYKTYHDEIVNFRANDLFEEEMLSIKSKSLGHILRVSGVICLLREAKELDQFETLITKEDFLMAK